MRSELKQIRHKQLLRLLDSDPLMSDSELARELGVSVGTIRLDRGLLNVPELRERARQMAENASSRLTSMKQDEVIGEVIELEPNRIALSVLSTNREYAFRHTDLIADHYIYAQAASLAIAVVKEDLAIVGAARAQFKRPARVGDRLMACAKVGTHKENKYVVSVHTRIGNSEIFVARFVVEAMSGFAEAALPTAADAGLGG
ncbi:MAG: transcription factor FapR [Synergistaceae bacterium]|nr:transcription factor FapR [Synergistaceae bacterium]